MTIEEWMRYFSFQNELEKNAFDFAYREGARNTDVANIIVERCITELDAVLK